MENNSNNSNSNHIGDIDSTVATHDNENSIHQEPLDKAGSIISENEQKSNNYASSIVVEINDADDEDIDIENEKSSNKSLTDIDQNNNSKDTKDLKNKVEMTDNRVSLTTTADLTYVDSNQTPNEVDLTMPENSDIVNTNLKRLTDTTSVPTIIDDKTKENPNDVDKATADISNKEHKITIDEDEDNTCAICLIETQKPTDIQNIGGSNETVVAPTKEDIDNYECKLHCMHKFHYSCIAQWLERNQNCPICRVDIKHYEIEAIEKRFDISIKVKNEEVPLIVPRYNTTFEFDNIPLTVELIKNYMDQHFPWVDFNTYFYTKFFFYLTGFFLLTVFGTVICIISLLKGHERFYFAFYCYAITLIVGFIFFIIQYIYNIIKKNTMLFMIRTPASSSFFYGMVSIIFLTIFITMTYLTETKDKPFTIEKIYEYCIIAFFGLMLIWAYVEAIIGYRMFREEDRRIVDADVSRRNQEIVERNRREEAEEREEFERRFSHLND